MPFPERKRILYKKNPLDRVICQLRFPALLRIETEIPAEFQERIRHDFPNFIEKSEVKVEMPVNIPGQSASDFPVQITPKASNNYEFSSDNAERRVYAHASAIIKTYDESKSIRSRWVDLLVS